MKLKPSSAKMRFLIYVCKAPKIRPKLGIPTLWKNTKAAQMDGLLNLSRHKLSW